MKLLNIDTDLKLNVDDTLLVFLLETGKKFYPKEFGGFLLGYYSEDFTTLNITNTLLPKKFKSTITTFDRETTGLENEFDDFYKKVPSEFYVGEWHTHPNGSNGLSSTDLKAVKSIISDDKIVIKNPVFLIISFNNTSVEFGFYLVFKNKIYKYEQQDKYF